MKIAMIGLRGIPGKSGGVEVVVDNLAPLLAKHGAEVTVYCRNPYCKDRPKEYKGVKLIYLPTLNFKHTEALSHSFLATMHTLTKDYDIIHYHAMGNGIFSFIPRILRKKTIVTLHGLDYQREKWGTIATIYLKTCEKILTLFPNKVISVSKKIKEHYRKKYKKDICFIPNGVDINNSIPIDNLKRFNLKKDDYILSIGRLVPEKGIHFLIKAFRQLKTEKKLLIAGDAGHTEAYVHDLRKLARGDKRIIFSGPLYGKDKQEAFSNALFFVLPSTIEGMPIVVLESMSYGLCPLVSDIKENIDIIEKDFGLSFKSKDVMDLKDKLEFCISNPKLLINKGNLAKDNVRKNYNWERISEEHIRIYGELING